MDSMESKSKFTPDPYLHETAPPWHEGQPRGPACVKQKRTQDLKFIPSQITNAWFRANQMRAFVPIKCMQLYITNEWLRVKGEDLDEDTGEFLIRKKLGQMDRIIFHLALTSTHHPL